jgi:hypothetical protein
LHLLLVIFVDPKEPRLFRFQDIHPVLRLKLSGPKSDVVVPRCKVSERVRTLQTLVEVLSVLEDLTDDDSVDSDASPAAKGNDR